MKRALVLSLVIHLAALGGLWWWSRNQAGAPALAVHFAYTKPNETPPLKTGPRKAGPAAVAGVRTSMKDPAAESGSLLAEPLAAEPQGGPIETAPTETRGNEPTSTEATPKLVQAVLTAEVKPPYPRAARARQWEGTVVVGVEVDPSGRWADGRVLTSSGHAILDEAALNALKHTTYQPASFDGVPVAGSLTARVTFVLKQD